MKQIKKNPDVPSWILFPYFVVISNFVKINDDCGINFNVRNLGFYMCNFLIQFWIYWRQILKS